MTNNTFGKEEAINQLYDTIKTKFEEDGVLQEVRCLLQTKMITMMKGKTECKSLLETPPASTREGEKHIKLINQLIMEYFHWHGLHYSSEIFSLESSCENLKPNRQCLEDVLGNFDHKEVPILVEVVTTLLEKFNNK